MVAGHRRSDARRSRAARRRRLRSSASTEPGPQRGTEGRRVAGRDQQPRPGTVLPVPEGLGHPADLGGEDRQAAGQGLGDDHAERLGV